MKTKLLVVLAMLLSATLGASVRAEFSAPASPDGGYDFDWSGCSLHEALQEMYARFSIPSVAVLLANEKRPAISPCPFRTIPKCVPGAIATSIERDSTYVGEVNVFRPYRLGSLSFARQLVACRLAASLTGEQLQDHLELGGISYGRLSAWQQECVHYLIRTASGPEAVIPEPALSGLIRDAKVMLAVHARISFEYVTPQGRGGGGFPCDSGASQDLWKRWGPGQLKAWQLSEKSQTEAGPDVPGDTSTCDLSGIYRLKDLVEIIERAADAGVSCDPAYGGTLVAAYCKLTTAALARACSIATGMEWRNEAGKWRLTFGRLADVLAAYGPGTFDSYFKSWTELKPKLEELMRSGKLFLVVDDEWSDLKTYQEMMQGNAVEWQALTLEQQEYLRRWHERHNEAYGTSHDPLPNLPELKMRWRPALKLYVPSGDWILFSEWLGHR